MRSLRYYAPFIVLIITWCAVRFGAGRVTTTFDEAYYLSTVKTGGVYSGLFVPSLLRGLTLVTGNPVLGLLLLSIVTFIAYYYLVRWFATGMGFKVNQASLLIAILLSSHFLWNANEIRPQAFGIMIGIPLLYLLFKKSPGPRWALSVLLLWTALTFVHVLSFFIFLSIYWAVELFYLANGKTSAKGYALSMSLPLVGLLVFLLMPQYRSTIFSAKWILKHSSLHLLESAGWNFSGAILSSYVAIVAGGLVLGVVLKGPLLRAGSLLLGILRMGRMKLWIAVLSGLFLLLIILQFWLNRALYTGLYSDNWGLPFLMQAGNFLFVLLFLYRLLERARGSMNIPYFITLLTLVLSGISGIAASFFMPTGFGAFGFRNWGLRAYQYFAVFAVPCVAEKVFKLNPPRTSSKKSLAVVFGIFIAVSVANVARLPPIYRYPYYWNLGDIEFASTATPGFFFSPGYGIPPNSVAVELLGWAYGVHLEPLRGTKAPPKPDVCSSTLCHVPFPYRLEPIGNSTTLSPSTIVWGHVPEGVKGTVMGMIPNAGGGNYRLIIGNSSTNGLILLLEDEYLIPVTVNYSVITGPTFRYFYAIHAGRENWDVTRGTFAIQSVLVNGSHYIVVSGNCWDAVVAGLHYLFGLKGSKASVIVGEWVEEDGEVLPGLRLSTADHNGFSYGDSIRILYRG